MEKYTVALVRARLSEALDQAERGEPVLIVRRGVTYRLSVEPPPARKTRSTLIEVLDRAVEEGQWTWDWADGQLQFRTRRRKR